MQGGVLNIIRIGSTKWDGKMISEIVELNGDGNREVNGEVNGEVKVE